jgi:hypothetical protein
MRHVQDGSREAGVVAGTLFGSSATFNRAARV